MNMYSGILVKSGNKVLLCKRCSKCSLPNVWSFPSGHVEKGESTLDAARREFLEETDVKISNVRLLGLLKSRTGKGLVYVYLHETKKTIEPDLDNAKDGEEHSECKYFSLDEIDTKKTTPELYELIKKVLS
jgi:ADP-ribose pyrophosphatase YjhB (NUDIX family)